MANLDIAIVFIVLVVGLLMTFSGVWLSQWLLYLFSAVYGIVVIGYFGNNYSLVNVGTFTISFYPVFTLAFFFLLIIMPLVLLYERH